MNNKQNIKSFNAAGQRHGHTEWYYSNGNLHYKGNYINNIKNGFWEWYKADGSVMYKSTFINGIELGYDEYPEENKTVFHLI